MTRQPLSGHQIITTRPAAQAAGLIAALQEAGATAWNFPVIRIAPADPGALRTLRLDTFDLAFFVSPNAVDLAMQGRPAVEWPAGLRMAAVGPGSVRALESHGFRSVLSPAARFDSEGVLALPEFSEAAVAGRRILIVRGDGGREVLADTLRQRGAEVSIVACYRRICATLDPAPLEQEFRAGKISALVFSASQGLTFFLEIMGESGREMLCRIPTFAPHPRICEALLQAGASAPVVTAGGDAGIVADIVRTLGDQPPPVRLPT